MEISPRLSLDNVIPSADVFIAYSHDDAHLQQMLLKQLAPLNGRGGSCCCVWLRSDAEYRTVGAAEKNADAIAAISARPHACPLGLLTVVFIFRCSPSAHF